MLKIINSRDSARLDSEAHFGVQAKVLAHLDRCSSGGKSSCGGLTVPLPLPNVDGQLHSLEKLQCQVRLSLIALGKIDGWRNSKCSCRF